MEGERADADKGKKEDLTWLNQYYTAEKTAARSGGKTEATVVVGEQVRPPPGIEGMALTALPSAKYDVVGPVGSGGMKVVRRVRDKDTMRTVAMATMRGELDGEEMLARFVREARITAILEHPNIVPVHDLGLDATGRPYFTMKMLEGESLQDILKKLEARSPEHMSRYTPGALLEIFKKVCNAIAFAHSKGVVHLDLKPSNIHVSRFGEVLVLDWGLAKYVGEATEAASAGHAESVTGPMNDLTLPGAVKGTLGFMAPEQARGENSRKDKRTDIYALGALLYALLTLKAPPSSDTVERVLADTMAGNIIPPRRRTPERNVAAALEAVAMKALSLEPERRYQTVEELVRDVDAFMGGFATSAQDVGILTLLWLLVKRHKVRFALSAVVLLLIAGITAVSMVRIRASEREAVEAYSKYRAEQEENRKLGVDAAPQVMKRAEKFMRELKIDEAMRELDLAVTLDGTLAAAWMNKGYLQLARQDFPAALDSFRHVPMPQKAVPALSPDRRKEKELAPAVPPAKGRPEKRASEPEAMAAKYLLMTEGGSKPLNHAEFCAFASNLVQVVSKAGADVRSAAVFHAFSLWNQAHGEERAVREFAVDFLRALNPKAERPTFELTEEERARKLVVRRGRGVQNIASLAGLEITWLDLSGTAVNDISILHGMPLAYLDISGTMVRDLTPVADAPLKELRMEGCKGLDVTQVTRLGHLARLTVSRDMITANLEALLKRNAYLEVTYR